MRRGLTSLILFVATTCAGLSLTCFIALHTVADPTRPARIADAVLSSGAGQRVLSSTLAGTVTHLVPAVPPAEAQQIAARAVADPRLAAAVRAAATGNGTVQLGPVLHDAAAGIDPQLAAAVPATGLTVPLPGRGLTWLAPIRSALARAWHDLALLALAAFAVAAVLGPNRARVLRRAGSWCVAATLVGVAFFEVLPAVLESVGKDWASAAAVALRAAGDGVVGPLIGVFAVGLVLLAAGVAARFLRPIAPRRV